MAKDEPCCPAAVARMVKKLVLPGGSAVGISNLENILKEVADLGLADNEAIKKELLKRVKIYNYVPPSVDDAYSGALLEEYKRQYGNPNKKVK